MYALVLICIKQHTKFEVLSFTNSKMSLRQNLKNGSRDPHILSTYVKNWTTLASAVPEISMGASEFRMGGHVTLTMPLIRVICHPYAWT